MLAKNRHRQGLPSRILELLPHGQGSYNSWLYYIEAKKKKTVMVD
jgi:hypothetical protein